MPAEQQLEQPITTLTGSYDLETGTTGTAVSQYVAPTKVLWVNYSDVQATNLYTRIFEVLLGLLMLFLGLVIDRMVSEEGFLLGVSAERRMNDAILLIILIVSGLGTALTGLALHLREKRLIESAVPLPGFKPSASPSGSEAWPQVGPPPHSDGAEVSADLPRA